MKGKVLIILGSTVCLIALIALLLTAGDDSCKGECKTELGLGDLTVNQRNKQYYENQQRKAKELEIYVEASLSMDGYVNGNTMFKTQCAAFMSDVLANDIESDTAKCILICNDKSVETNYNDPTKFFRELAPNLFSTLCASDKRANLDRANSDLSQAMKTVLAQSSDQTVSVLISDFVFSPSGDEDVENALGIQTSELKNALLNKAKESLDLGVLIYRLESQFNGIYYDKTNAHITDVKERPFFIWIFGKSSVLTSIHKSLESVATKYKAEDICAVETIGFTPYKVLKAKHTYHCLNAKTNKDGIYKVSFLADLHAVPESEDYLLNTNNYIVSNADSIQIEPYTDKDDSENYNYKITLTVQGKEDYMVTPRMIEVSLKAPHFKNVWDKYNDPNGNDKGYPHEPPAKATDASATAKSNSATSTLRTFGIASLVEAIDQHFNRDKYTIYKIKIN